VGNVIILLASYYFSYLERNGISPILDYAAEPDVSDVEGAPEAESVTSPLYDGVDSARVYDYTTERKCDQNAEIFEKAIKSVKNVSPAGFAAIKITALGNPLLLERWSTVSI
jgi:proline dehydrogenase